MKYISEKEKKLEDALKKLKKLDLKNDQISEDIKELVDQIKRFFPPINKQATGLFYGIIKH